MLKPLIIFAVTRLETESTIDDVLALKVMQYNPAWAQYYLRKFEARAHRRLNLSN
jgi:hypothetical protein